jgi:PAS domain S-box-containing protein
MTDIPSIVAEPYRLKALDSYDILDSAPEAGFDDIVLLAREICQTPIALVSFVEPKRQWFKAASGTELCQTPIEQSVCAHALAQPDTLVIPDLTQDERTKSNVLVTSEPHIRFYAGALLKSAEGVPLGTLCVIDLEPRPQGLTTGQISGLEALARQVMHLLELRKALIVSEGSLDQSEHSLDTGQPSPATSEQFIVRLQDSERRLRMAQEAGQIGTFEIDIRTNCLRASEQFCRTYGLPVKPWLDASEIEKLIYPEDADRISNAQNRTIGDTDRITEYRVTRPDDGRVVWIARRAEFVRDSNGRPLRMLGTVHDITERKKAEES